MADDDKLDRIVLARMKLRDRFLDGIRTSPSMADDEPQGSGPRNRHGMPQLPPDQYDYWRDIAPRFFPKDMQ